MRLHTLVRWGTVVISAAVLLAVPACGGGSQEPAASPAGGPAAGSAANRAPNEPLKNEIPPSELEKVMTAHYRGLGYMEQYEYKSAIESFREVRKRAPGWIPGMINLAIALLNDSGVEAEQAKKVGAEPPPDNYDEALDLLASVLERDTDNPYAHFSRGIILQSQGHLLEAHRHFKRVTEIDPNDGSAWFQMGGTLAVSVSPNPKERREQAKQAIVLFEKALACDPYLTPAIYKLAFAYVYAGEPQKQKELLDRWNQINPDRPSATPGPGETADTAYGDMGKYASIIDPFPRPEPSLEAAKAVLRYEPGAPLKVSLPPGDRWVRPADFTGPLAVIGRARARFGAAVAAFDADGDGRLDLFLGSAVVGAKGIRDALLLNKGDCRFEDASASFGLPADHASLGAAAADFDADRQIDLFLTGIGVNRLLHNRDGKRFDDVSTAIKGIGPPAVSLMARWLDLDQDGDLDLYVVNYCAKEHAAEAFTGAAEPPPGVPNAVYRNDGQPASDPTSPPAAWAPLAVATESVKATAGLSLAFTPWTGEEALAGGTNPHSGIAALDIENDRDLDLVLASDGAPPQAIINDRLGQYHSVKLETLALPTGVSGLLVNDVDADGLGDLVAPRADGPVLVFRNTTKRTTVLATKYAFQAWPTGPSKFRAAQAVDLDLDGRTDLLGLPAASAKPDETGLIAWARNEGARFTAKPLSIGLQNPADLDALLAVDLIGDSLPDLVAVRSGEPPVVAQNLGNGNHWLVLQLGGHWNVRKKLMRTNSHAIGSRVTLQGVGTFTTYEHTTYESGLSQSITPIVLGLGTHEGTDLVRVAWPDGVNQCELSVTANEKIALFENNRKISSCPVLFAWNGRRFVCIGDFLGGGGLGYLIAPGVYSQPDRDEAVAITAEQLQESDGYFRLSVTEPMDEIAYLDHLRLDVVDRPPGVSSTPDERFAPHGPRPSGDVIAWQMTVEPKRATDLEGRDVTETLRHWDRRTVDAIYTRNGWIGYALGHGIILDFGDRLSRFSASDPLVLCLAGWVEYPYSQTNYAATTAGVALEPPSIERLDESSKWQLIEPHAGYPAGMPRLTTLELTGKLAGPQCVLRIKTNMECYYDQAFIAVRDRTAEAALRVTKLHVTNAALGYRGYTREVSPDGHQPLLYDYDYVDPAPLARFSGKLTRYGDVAPLLRSDDDQFCVVGPGDEVRLEFSTASLPDLPAGWTRSYMLRSYGYCKDADLFTATSDAVGPLPWRGMPPFPFAPGVTRPVDPAYESYLRSYQTRPAGGGIHR